jgi:hypothetical protein
MFHFIIKTMKEPSLGDQLTQPALFEKFHQQKLQPNGLNREKDSMELPK